LQLCLELRCQIFNFFKIQIVLHQIKLRKIKGNNNCVIVVKYSWIIRSVPLATEPGISLIIFTTNEDIATKFDADLPHCVRNVKEKNVFLFKFRCNIFIGVRIIKEMPGLLATGTLCTIVP
jgi:hypothetical protein